MIEIMIEQGFPRAFLNRYSISDIKKQISKEQRHQITYWTGNLYNSTVGKNWLYLYGEVGEWKTALAVCLSRWLLEKDFIVSDNYDAFYRNCSSLFDWLRTFKGDEPFDLSMWNRIQESGLLVLDDFGREADSLYIYQKM